jgi:hypothetical protein
VPGFGPPAAQPGTGLVLIARLVLAEVLVRGVDGAIDLVVVLVVGVVFGYPGDLVDSLVRLLWMLLDKVLGLLLQVAEFAHAILLRLTGPDLPPGRAVQSPYPPAGVSMRG